MPYLGRVTLADVLADPRTRAARTGADLLAALDGLRSPDDTDPLVSARSEARAALRGRTVAQAIAWWGARLAEALQHAHDRGVLHRDVKPSNVIVTADATPMLLDFNLARPSDIDSRSSADVGGTPAYMAPEHIEAVAKAGERGAGDDLVVNGRADIYSLGVVLFEALCSRPFSPPAIIRPDADSLRSLIEARRTPAPRLKTGAAGRKIPAALGVVVQRCLEPDPADRYTSAAELAADLRAVADNGPLRFAREPQPARALRWAARNRRALFIALTMLAAAAALFVAQSAAWRREGMARSSFEAGVLSANAGEFVAAASQFAVAAELASGTWSASLRSMATEAGRRRQDALQAENIRYRADAFFRTAESIRFRLITRHGLDSASRDLQEAFAEFRVLSPTPWTRDPELNRLDPYRRARLIEEANELLFLWVVNADRRGDHQTARRAAAVCDRALSFAEPRGPWLALRARYQQGRARATDRDSPPPSAESSARACFEWGILSSLEGRPGHSLAWFERAVGLHPDRFWYQFALAYHHALHGDATKAMSHYTAAEALRPGSSWALLNRAGRLVAPGGVGIGDARHQPGAGESRWARPGPAGVGARTDRPAARRFPDGAGARSGRDRIRCRRRSRPARPVEPGPGRGRTRAPRPRQGVGGIRVPAGRRSRRRGGAGRPRLARAPARAARGRRGRSDEPARSPRLGAQRRPAARRMVRGQGPVAPGAAAAGRRGVRRRGSRPDRPVPRAAPRPHSRRDRRGTRSRTRLARSRRTGPPPRSRRAARGRPAGGGRTAQRGRRGRGTGIRSRRRVSAADDASGDAQRPGESSRVAGGSRSRGQPESLVRPKRGSSAPGSVNVRATSSVPRPTSSEDLHSPPETRGSRPSAVASWSSKGGLSPASRCWSWHWPRAPAGRPTPRRPGRSASSARWKKPPESGPSHSETTPKIPTASSVAHAASSGLAGGTPLSPTWRAP